MIRRATVQNRGTPNHNSTVTSYKKKCNNRSSKTFAMIFLEGELYHIYNRGNNRQKIFFKDDI